MTPSTIEALALPSQGTQPLIRSRRRFAAVPFHVWAVVIVLYATLLPREMRLDINGLVYLPERIALLLTLPYIVKRLIDGVVRPSWIDALVLVSASWMIISMMVNYGLESGLERGGALALDMALGYILARVCIRGFDDFRRILILLAPGVFLVGSVMAIESVTRTPIVEPVVTQIFGRLPIYENGVAVGLEDGLYEIRAGLMRAKSVFPHSILGGLYMVSLFGVYCYSGIRNWPFWAGMIASVCGLFSLSSAAFLGLSLIVSLALVETAKRFTHLANWRLVFIAIATLAAVLHLVSKSGLVSVIIRYGTFNPATGAYRLLIWEYGLLSVSNHPWFGIGFAGYERLNWMVSASVDNHWLLLAMRHGIVPAVASFLAATLAIALLSHRSSRLAQGDRKFARGIAMSLGVLTLMMFTVTLWGGPQTWYTILLGATVSLSAVPLSGRRV